MREITGVERPFVRACKRLGYLALKFVTPGTRGPPDRIVFKGLDGARELLVGAEWYCGHNSEQHVREILSCAIEFVELKAPDGALRDEQVRMHRKLRGLGFKVTVLSHPDEVKTWAQSA